MNQNQVKGAIKDAAGKVQRKTGEITGSDSQKIKGASKQVEGKTQKAAGDAQEHLEEKLENTRERQEPYSR